MDSKHETCALVVDETLLHGMHPHAETGAAIAGAVLASITQR